MTMPAELVTKVGVGVMVLRDKKILLGKRKGSHGEGEYAFRGGHLEYMESFEGCAKRETIEETGLEIENIRFLYLANLKLYAPKHYVHIGLIGDWKSGVPKVIEQDKCESWGWFDFGDLPAPLFATCQQSIDAYTNKRIYFDA